MITMTGHGGFFNIIPWPSSSPSASKNKVLSIFSVDEDYKAGNLFGDLESVVGEVLNNRIIQIASELSTFAHNCLYQARKPDDVSPRTIEPNTESPRKLKSLEGYDLKLIYI